MNDESFAFTGSPACHPRSERLCLGIRPRPLGKVTILQDEVLKNVPGKKALMIEVDYKPGQFSIAHKHEGTAMAYVISGSIVSQVKGEQPKTYKTGEYWYEPAGSEHMVSKNASATTPAKLLVFMVLSPDEKVLIPLEN